MYVVEGTSIRWKFADGCPQTSSDNGKTWHFTFRGLAEFKLLHPTLRPI